jgi:hypothetical protein
MIKAIPFGRIEDEATIRSYFSNHPIIFPELLGELEL